MNRPHAAWKITHHGTVEQLVLVLVPVLARIVSGTDGEPTGRVVGAFPKDRASSPKRCECQHPASGKHGPRLGCTCALQEVGQRLTTQTSLRQYRRCAEVPGRVADEDRIRVGR